jgi:hypothetical protein
MTDNLNEKDQFAIWDKMVDTDIKTRRLGKFLSLLKANPNAWYELGEEKETQLVCDELLVKFMDYDRNEAQLLWSKAITESPATNVRDRLIFLLESELKKLIGTE